jgi:prepilin-type N-terminal cleavage/methylation domain-containing protein
MRLKRTNPKRRGFTLVEVLASLAIFAIIVPFAMRGATLASRAGSLARHQAEAATLGETELGELVATGNYATVGGQGNFGADFPQYQWSLQSNPRSDVDVTELLLTVTWQERGQERSLKLSTMVYANAGAAGAAAATGTGGGQ